MRDDSELGRNAEREDGSGEEYSRNLLECIRQMIIVEAKVQRSSNIGSQAGKNQMKMAGKVPSGGHLGIREVSGKEISINTDSHSEGNDPEDEPAKYKEENRRRKQGEKQDEGSVSLQCCDDMAH